MSSSEASQERIVSWGAEVERELGSYVSDVAQIEWEVREQFREALSSAGRLGRVAIAWRIRREIARRVNALSPNAALYLVSKS